MARYYSSRKYAAKGVRYSPSTLSRVQPYFLRNKTPNVQESKFFEFLDHVQSFGNTIGPEMNPPGTGRYACAKVLNLIPNGNGMMGRNNSRIMMRSLFINGSIELPHTSNGNPLNPDTNVSPPLFDVSMILVYNIQQESNTHLHTMTEFLTQPISAFSLPTLDVFHNNQIIWRRDFKVSWDIVGASGTAGASQSTYRAIGHNSEVHFDYKIPLDLPTVFAPGAIINPLLTAIRSGTLTMYYVCSMPPPTSDTNVGLGPAPYARMNTRLAFTEY